MFLHIIFLLIALCSSNAFGSENNIPAQPYTAEQHLKDIQILLGSLKYKDHEIIGFFSFKKRRTNQKFDSINHAFEQKLKEKGSEVFFLRALPFISIAIHKKGYLTIPPSKALCFYETFIAINKKRNKELRRLGKENLVEDQGWR